MAHRPSVRGARDAATPHRETLTDAEPGDPTDTADTHGCTENGAADRRRKESRFAVPEEMKRDGRGEG